MINGMKGRRGALWTSASALAVGIGLAAAGPASAIVINDGFTPAQAVDPTNITGVAQMVVDSQNGFLGLCTATLINPRTVIFAAHCVNENSSETAFQSAGSYGAKFGGVPIGFGFQANNLPGVRSWYLPGPNHYRTNTSVAFYNSNYVTYDTDSTKLGVGKNFLQGDVALAALDTPAAGIPTWTLLFSALPAPTGAGTAAGTGYHVTIDGYGTNGTGTTGAVGAIDFRRRIAENMIGILGSLDDQDNFLFGAKDGLPQNLYQIDFDDPKRANPYDFNVFRDNATPREGTIGPGDSGGPLILDKAFAKPTVIAVLSGSDRFFNGQPVNSYGTTGFYQPLYLFWDFVVANNPYKYVSAQAGDGKWADPNHWVINLDPNYQVLNASGQPVNGLPTTPAAGITGTAGKFGQVCFQQTGVVNDCLNIGTGVETVNNNPIGTSGTAAPTTTAAAAGHLNAGLATGSPAVVAGTNVLSSAPATVSSATLGGGDGSTTTAAATASASPSSSSTASTTTAAASGRLTPGLASGSPATVAGTDILSSAPATVSGAALASGSTDSTATTAVAAATPSADGGGAPTDAASLAAAIAALPAPTAANGLPGATGFVPNDTDGNPTLGQPARYYDVTLSAQGTTTLDGFATVDRLTINGATSGLTISQQGILASLIDTTQYAGTATINGQLITAGDYALIGGLLQGTGIVQTPYLTSVAGVIAPAGIGTIGALTIKGDVILSSGSQLGIDLGANGASDRLIVQRNFLTPNNPGLVSLGGLLALNPVAGYLPRFGDRFTILTADGGVQGNFTAVNALSAILVPQVAVSANQVAVSLAALPYASVVSPASPIQVGFAQLLDQNRLGNYQQLSNLFGQLDIQNQGVIQGTLETMAPYAETTKVSLARMQTDSLARLWRERIGLARTGQASGGLAVIGQPLLLAAQDLRQSPVDRPGATDAQGPRMAPDVRLPDGFSAFVAGGYLNGTSKPLAGGLSLGRHDQLDGYYVAGGGEYQGSTPLTLGAAFAYSSASGKFTGLQSARDELYQGAVYGSYRLPKGFFVTSQVTGGQEISRTRRTFVVGATIYNVSSRDVSPAFTVEGDLGKDFAFRGLTLTPTAGLRYTHIDFGPSAESGGDAALAYGGRSLEGLESRLGGDVGGVFRHMGLSIRPHLTATYVHDFEASRVNTPALFFAGVGPYVTFAGPKRSQDWGEVGGGVTITGGRVDLNLSADTNVGRDDLNYQTYRASISYKF